MSKLSIWTVYGSRAIILHRIYSLNIDVYKQTINFILFDYII